MVFRKGFKRLGVGFGLRSGRDGSNVRETLMVIFKGEFRKKKCWGSVV